VVLRIVAVLLSMDILSTNALVVHGHDISVVTADVPLLVLVGVL